MEQLRITVEGKVYEVTVERTDAADTASPVVRHIPSAAPASAPAPAPAATPAPAAAQAGDIPSPLAGVVQSVEAKVGDTVAEGDLILTLEAMKMYTPINAPSGGTIKAVLVKAGDAVEEGQALVSIA